MGVLLSIMFIGAMGCIGTGAVLVGVGTIMWVKNENQIRMSEHMWNILHDVEHWEDNVRE